ncbi:hypothetical protein GCM10009000_083260 [Halobacterium noricense]|uniref:Uncharacterized protein n=1 Tax=Haladaptatus pallidirubidus TaxID=1008152 RepID=A0AAV3URR6_9EURY
MLSGVVVALIGDFDQSGLFDGDGELFGLCAFLYPRGGFTGDELFNCFLMTNGIEARLAVHEFVGIGSFGQRALVFVVG